MHYNIYQSAAIRELPHLLLLLFVHSQLLTLFHILPPRFRCLITSRKRVEFIFSEDAHSSHSERAQDDNFLSGWMRHEPLFPILFLCGLNYLCQGRCVIGSVITQNLWMHLHDFFNFLIFFYQGLAELRSDYLLEFVQIWIQGLMEGFTIVRQSRITHIHKYKYNLNFKKRDNFFFWFCQENFTCSGGHSTSYQKVSSPYWYQANIMQILRYIRLKVQVDGTVKLCWSALVTFTIEWATDKSIWSYLNFECGTDH